MRQSGIFTLVSREMPLTHGLQPQIHVAGTSFHYLMLASQMHCFAKPNSYIIQSDQVPRPIVVSFLGILRGFCLNITQLINCRLKLASATTTRENGLMPEPISNCYLENTFLSRRKPLTIRGFAAVALVLCNAFFSGISFANDRIALVIGNQSYTNAPLDNPANDADAVGNELKAMGYATTVVKDATREGIEEALDNFSLAAEQSDFALFYYAGHAIQVDGKNYIIPVGSQSRRSHH